MFEVNLCLDRGRYHVKSSGYSCQCRCCPVCHKTTTNDFSKFGLCTKRNILNMKFLLPNENEPMKPQLRCHLPSFLRSIYIFVSISPSLFASSSCTSTHAGTASLLLVNCYLSCCIVKGPRDCFLSIFLHLFVSL